MKNNKNKIFVSSISAFLLLVLYFMIFTFSEQDGQQSGSISRLLSQKMMELFNEFTFRGWTEEFVKEMALWFEHPLRKMAHFAEYAIMGTLVYSVLYPWKVKFLKRLCIVWVFLSACADEIHQAFVPGRYGNFPDVILDTLGGAFGVALCCFAQILFTYIKKRMR